MFLWWQDGKRKSKSLGHHPTKASAWRTAKPLRDALEYRAPVQASTAPKVSTLIDHYRAEKMPTRHSTRLAYEAWFRNHILPRFGDCQLTDVQARTVELWLHSLQLSPKSKAHIRGLLHVLIDYAMWAGHLPVQRNPIELVTVKGATKRTRKPRSLTVEEFRRFASNLDEPFRTIAVLCVSLGLRISEALGLKWSDVDWLSNRLRVERGIVRQVVGDVKTSGSERMMALDTELLAVLKAWHGASEFTGADDWMFASPVKLGRLPWSYPHIWQRFQKASAAAKVGRLGTHTMRHTFRSWLDSVGTPLAVQQKLMRHADIRTTMNIYGDVVTDEMQKAGSQVARLAVNGL